MLKENWDPPKAAIARSVLVIWQVQSHHCFERVVEGLWVYLDANIESTTTKKLKKMQLLSISTTNC